MADVGSGLHPTRHEDGASYATTRDAGLLECAEYPLVTFVPWAMEASTTAQPSTTSLDGSLKESLLTHMWCLYKIRVSFNTRRHDTARTIPYFDHDSTHTYKLLKSSVLS